LWGGTFRTLENGPGRHSWARLVAAKAGEGTWRQSSLRYTPRLLRFKVQKKRPAKAGRHSTARGGFPRVRKSTPETV
jgi:hypothetical protein